MQLWLNKAGWDSLLTAPVVSGAGRGGLLVCNLASFVQVVGKRSTCWKRHPFDLIFMCVHD